MRARIKLLIHPALAVALSVAAPSSAPAQGQPINGFYDLKHRPLAMRTPGPPLAPTPPVEREEQAAANPMPKDANLDNAPRAKPPLPATTSPHEREEQAMGDSRAEAANSGPPLPAKPAKPPPLHWQVHGGERLTDVVVRFAARAGYAFQPPEAPVIWRIDHDAGIDGDFPAALQWLADGFASARSRPYFKLYANNVLRLEAR